MRWLDGIIDLMDVSLGKLREMVDREGWCAIVYRVAKRWTQLKRLNNNKNPEAALRDVCTLSFVSAHTLKMVPVSIIKESGLRGHRCN